MSLEDIREQKKSKGVYIIIGMLLVGMAGFGTSQFGGFNSGEPAAISLGELEVSMSTFNNVLNANRQRYPDQDDDVLREMTLTQLSRDIALDNYLSKHPIIASPKMVDEAIRNNPNFFEGGQFSEAVFRRLIHVEPQAYRKAIANDIGKQYFQNILGSTAIVSEAEMLPHIEMRTVERDVAVVKIPKADVENTATDEEITAYYNENKENYMTDEQVELEYIELNPERIAENMTVSDAELDAAAKPARSVNYYAFEMRESAESYRRGDKEGVQFTDSGELSQLSAVASDDSLIPQQALDVIFAMSDKGEMSEVVDVDGAFYVFELLEVPQLQLDEKQLTAIKRQLQQAKATPEIAAINEKLNKAFFESDSPDLQTIAEATGLSVENTGKVSLLSGKGVLGTPELVQAIQASDKSIGKLQEPVVSDEKVIIYRLKAFQSPEQEPLEKVKADIKQIVIADKNNQQLKNSADKLIAEAQAQGDLLAVAESMGYSGGLYENFNEKSGNDNLLDPIGALLIMQAEPVLGVENAKQIQSLTGDVYVYADLQVRLKPDTVTEEAKQQINSSVIFKVAQAELNSFLQSLMLNADIKTRVAVLSKVN